MIQNIHLDQSEAEIHTIHIQNKERTGKEIDYQSSLAGPALEVHSEMPFPKNHPELNNVQYKKSLVKLMVRVKLERFGFKQADLDRIIDQELAGIDRLENIEARHLHDIATELFLDVFSNIIGERNFLARLVRVRGRMEEEEENQLPPLRPLSNRIVQGQQERQSPSILCNICYLTSNNYCEQACGHTFCHDCMKGYLIENINSDNYFIKCAEYDCRDLISISTIQKLLSPSQFKRFIYFREKNQKELNPDNKFCSKPDCGELLETREDDKLVCPKCLTQYCEICLQNYHGQQKCDTILKKALENTFQTLQIKKCPGCKSPIEKSDGCNHMTCKKCRFEFCWLCQKKYSKHHFRYYNCFGCPGMQFESEEQAIAQRMKQICLYCILPFILSILLLCYLAVVPLYMIGSWLAKSYIWSEEQKQFCECKIADFLCCSLDCCLKRFFIFLLLQPRAILYAVFISPLKLTTMMCGELCEVFQ